eukprot:Rmarinus@m.17111
MELNLYRTETPTHTAVEGGGKCHSIQCSSSDCSSRATYGLVCYGLRKSTALAVLPGRFVSSISLLMDVQPKLETFCARFSRSRMTLTEVTKQFETAKKFKVDSHLKVCRQYIRDNAAAVFVSPAILSLTKESLLDFVKDSNLNIEELELFRAILRWAEDKRGVVPTKEFVSDFLPHIRYPLIPPRDLRDYVAPLNIVPQDFMVEALFHSLADGRATPSSEKHRSMNKDNPRMVPRKGDGKPVLRWIEENAQFSVSDDGLLARKCGKKCTWATIVSSVPLPHARKYSVHVKLSRTKTSDLMIGVAPTPSTAKAAFQTGGYMYYCFDGLKYEAGESCSYGEPLVEGDVLSVELDFSADDGTCTISFFKNGTSMGVAFDSVKLENYYIGADVLEPEDAISFVKQV